MCLCLYKEISMKLVFHIFLLGARIFWLKPMPILYCLTEMNPCIYLAVIIPIQGCW